MWRIGKRETTQATMRMYLKEILSWKEEHVVLYREMFVR